jgi:cell division protein FtsB
MIGNLVEALGQRLKGRWLALAVTLILAYFGFHALHGRYGFLAWIDTSRDLVVARQQLAGFMAERQELQRDVQAFQQDSLDRDLLEEELRRLGYVRPNEVIVLRRDQEPPG